MKSILKYVGAVSFGLVASTGIAFAVGTPLPEPGTLALVGLGIAGVLLLGKRRK